MAERVEALNEAAGEAAVSKRFTNHLEAIWGRQLYFRFRGDQNALLEVLKEGTANCRNVMLDSSYAAALYTEGKFSEALAVLDRSPRGTGGATDFCRGYVLAELPDGPERAGRESEALLQNSPVLHGLYHQTVLSLVGHKPQAVAACIRLQGQSERAPVRGDWYQRLLDYCSDRLSADALLESAGGIEAGQSEAHFFIAMTRLAERNRQQARQHFRKAMGKYPIFTFYQIWSHAFLGRLEQDPAWPPWILQKALSASESSVTTEK